METGKVIRIIKNVPAPIPIEIGKKNGKKNGDSPLEIPRREFGTPITIPLPTRKEEVEV